jgi:hypothetical protein
MASDFVLGRFTLSAKQKESGALEEWWLTVVYGPQLDVDKAEFLAKLTNFRAVRSGPWCLCGDFNMIYRACDKNNDRLDRRSMRRFQTFLNSAQLEEIFLVGRRFTWSSHRDNPTLELLDRIFVSSEWLALFPNHSLRALSSDCSDHCPILLQLNVDFGSKRRFRFESFWTKLPGFLDILTAVWACSLTQADPFRLLDYKFRLLAKELKRWSCSKIGSIRLQLTMAREVILRFDEEQERRALEPWETDMRRQLKVRVLGLASLARTITRQRSRVLFLKRAMQTQDSSTCRLATAIGKIRSTASP